MAKNYTSKTASFKAVTIDVHKLEANNIKLGGQDILDTINTTKSDLSNSITTIKNELLDTIDTTKQDLLYAIDNATPTVKISTDTRETITENDLWGTYVETKDNGEIVIHDDFFDNPNLESKTAWNTQITTIENNKAYTSGGLYANIQTDKLVKGDCMFMNCSNFRYFNSDLSSLTSAREMFRACSVFNFKNFISNTSSLIDAYCMLSQNYKLQTFNSDLSSLVNGECMFGTLSAAPQSLTTFECNNLNSLQNGKGMFGGCLLLSSFEYDLPSLVDGSCMFLNTPIEKFSSNLSSLVDGSEMFKNSKIVTFTSDLPSLTHGWGMFKKCTSLTTFVSDLSSLTSGYDGGSEMFYMAKLNPRSVFYIAESLPTHSSESFIDIGIDVTNDSSTIQQQLQDFAQQASYDSWNDLKQAFINKNWSVTFQYGGTNSNITLSEDEQFRGVPVYAKLSEEVSEELGEYCTEDGQHFYNITWGHDVTHPQDFIYFGSLLEACGYFGVIPKIYLEEA